MVFVNCIGTILLETSSGTTRGFATFVIRRRPSLCAWMNPTLRRCLYLSLIHIYGLADRVAAPWIESREFDTGVYWSRRSGLPSWRYAPRFELSLFRGTTGSSKIEFSSPPTTSGVNCLSSIGFYLTYGWTELARKMGRGRLVAVLHEEAWNRPDDLGPVSYTHL